MKTEARRVVEVYSQIIVAKEVEKDKYLSGFTLSGFLFNLIVIVITAGD